MFSSDDDDPGNPLSVRRTLIPLNIEDAESPPSAGRRLWRIFRWKKRRAATENEDFPRPPRPEPRPDARPENAGTPDNDFPESLDGENGKADQE